MQQKTRTWSWVISANFSEGLPYTIINVMLVNLLTDMGCSNGVSAMIPSLLALPWTWKFLWSPLIDTHFTKRRWMLAMQLLLAASFFLVAFCLNSPWWLYIVIGCSSIAALASATYDVSCDGYYMLVLPPKDQAFFVGIRSTAYRIGMLFGSGFLVILAKDGTPDAWKQAFLVTGAILLGLALLHKFLLPDTEGKSINSASQESDDRSFKQVFLSFVELHPWREMLFIFSFILFYRLGEAFLGKVSILFLKDSVEHGGIGLNNEQYGFIYGTFGTLALIVGGILGGISISRWGLKRCLIPMVIALNVPDLFYVWLASPHFAELSTSLTSSTQHLSIIGTCVSIEQFGYGFGFTAFTVYLLECAKGPYQTSHYAFLTALMAIGLLLPSTISGYIQEAFHSYYYYFIMACLLTIPGILLSCYYVYRQKRLHQ